MENKSNRAAMEFSLNYQSNVATHTDRWFVEKIDFWRDFFPGNMEEGVKNLHEHETYSENFAPGTLVPPFLERNIVQFPSKLFAMPGSGKPIPPSPGRFYPKGFAWKGLNTFPEDMTPCRIVDVTETTLTADINHPLAEFALTIEAKLKKHLNPVTQRGGSIHDIAELITADGPGMQVPSTSFRDVLAHHYPFGRENEADDTSFYASPRLVHHLDQTARQHVQNTYQRLLKPGEKILDLMSSWQSHLPDSLRDCDVTGLGLNEEELRQNKQLSSYTLHNLNNHPELPYPDQSFDAVICTVSIEYLSQPYEVMKEISRVLRKNGTCIIIISDRWFPGKQILPWSDLHPFERQGLVVDYFISRKSFSHLQTESIRGYPRPVDDAHFMSMRYADPIFAVWGVKTS
ncbi:methyltransferase domain-containing protein [Desulfogranum marinum]|uniref:methyltransferase domain-containing protein n=1 Tax=Desulfogranum marinum TaxID=453220 RepID=UPI0029C7F527|nr:methyltransferase domain-containing protein [Desulfogranum marinum]